MLFLRGSLLELTGELRNTTSSHLRVVRVTRGGIQTSGLHTRSPIESNVPPQLRGTALEEVDTSITYLQAPHDFKKLPPKVLQHHFAMQRQIHSGID